MTGLSPRPAGGGGRGGPGSGSPRCAAPPGRSPVSPPGTCPPGRSSAPPPWPPSVRSSPLRLRRDEDGTGGLPGNGASGRVAQAGRGRVARGQGAARVLRGRRGPGRLPDPPRLHGRGRVAAAAAAGRGVARVRGGKAAADVAWYGMEASARWGVTRSIAARRSATPYLLLDLARARESFRALAAALPGMAVHYAVKANPHRSAAGLPAPRRVPVRGRILGGGPRGDPGRCGPGNGAVHPSGQARR